MVDDRRKRYGSNFGRTLPNALGNNKAPMYGQYTPSGYLAKSQQDPMFFAQSNMVSHDQHTEPLAEAFGRVNLQNPYAASDKVTRPVSSQTYDSGVQFNSGIPQAIMYNGQLMFTGNQIHSGMMHNGNGMAQLSTMYPLGGAQYPNQPNFQYNSMQGTQTPLSSAWPGSRIPSHDVPSLVTPRRDSSSSQENDAPGTPFTQYNGYRDYSGGVAVVDRSPHSLCPAWSTPSPTQNGLKSHPATSISPRLQLLVQQEPAIPRAIPAPYSPVKPLDRALENANGVTNVYVRGLQPNTTDEMLYKLASRFGDILSSKSIIDHTTGKCKGFGFVKYHNFKDAEDCIRGFHYMGYETSFARLKKLSDENNTNLYVSNLPKEMNEHELGAIFIPHKVCSSRILRDGAGNGRGVGFARFESREICEIIIKNYDKTSIAAADGPAHTIQIRFADTQDQKSLKQQTTAARQYRTAEYESQTQGRALSMNVPRLIGPGPGTVTTDSDFESYMANATGTPSGPARGGSAARDRLTNFSSHLGTAPVSPNVNGNDTSVTGTVPEPRIATVTTGMKAEYYSQGQDAAKENNETSEDVIIHT